MRILWITNILFPEAEQLLTGNGELKASGGWMLGSAHALLQKDGIELYIASVSSKVHQLTKLVGKGIIYYVLPFGKGNCHVNPDYMPYWKQVQQETRPDVVHIHGTEFSHGYAYIKACGSHHVVVSIQGLLSAIAPYYCAGISKSQVISNITLRDILKGTILRTQQSFEKRSEYEIATICAVNHIIGRTSWDRAHIWAINPNATYHTCNETLRLEFYDGSVWKYENCRKHTIFLSQASYPIKGLHQVLEAMPFILRQFPDTQVRIAGYDITSRKNVYEKIKYSGYARYINRLIKKYKLEGKISFIGSLNSEGMKSEYLKANVFICPSAIENSPNSLGEAQILGVPCVASYVGGVADMMRGNEDNLYRFEEVEMLAEKICQIFAGRDKQVDMIHAASERHDRKTNCDNLYNIYRIICNS